MSFVKRFKILVEPANMHQTQADHRKGELKYECKLENRQFGATYPLSGARAYKARAAGGAVK